MNYSTIDKSTILTWNAQIVIEHYKKKQIDFIKLERNEILKQYDDYFNNKVDKYCYNVESIVIKSNCELIWEIITDWTIFQKYVPKIAESVEYEGEKLDVGTKICLKWKSKKVSCSLKIMGIVTNGFDYMIELKLSEGIPKLPLQKLVINLKALNEKTSFLNFKHLFLEPLEFHDIKNLSMNKRKILISLKNAIEKTV